MTWRETALAMLEHGEGAAPELPAFVIDAAAGTIVAANAAGWRAWGLDARVGSASVAIDVAIDRAMPALARLADASRGRAGEPLTFWTARGILPLRCRVEPLPLRAGAFVVRALPDAGAEAGQASAGAALPPASLPAPGLDDGRIDDGPSLSLARLAHEVRTPLSAAIAYAEVLKEEHFGPLADARYREYARHIYDSARHALCVVDGMLTRDAAGSGLPELAFRDLDAASVIDNCLALARPLAERAGLDLVAHPVQAKPRVIADEVSLKQMLLNLITNAIKFARPGDRITLATSHGADGSLRIEVADTGPGMAGAARGLGGGGDAHGGHRSAGDDGTEASAGGRGGLGIGLPLTRALAEANGAALIVDSAPGHGTRVTIAFAKDRVVPV
jgi:signal transduction histidine kinase